uniref:Uncharacterized protein n=1 Tax=Arundo donax TaxID=35708 RepID=A0A0A9FXV5_ARUDO
MIMAKFTFLFRKAIIASSSLAFYQ